MPVIAIIADWLVQVLQAAGIAGVFVGMVLESACIPVPSEIVLPFAGILVREQALTFAAAFGWAFAGQMVGSMITYLVGLYGGRPFIHRYGRYVLLRQHELAVAETWFQRYGEATVCLTRLLPGVRTFISLPAGIARMSFSRFVVYSALGVAPWTAFLIWAGMRVGRIWADPQWHLFFRIAEALVVAGLLALVIWFLWGRRAASRMRH